MSDEEVTTYSASLKRWISPSEWTRYFQERMGKRVIAYFDAHGARVKNEIDGDVEAEGEEIIPRGGRRLGITPEEKELRSLVVAQQDHLARCEAFIIEDPSCARHMRHSMCLVRLTLRNHRRRISELRKERMERKMRRQILKSLRRNAAASAERVMVMRPGERVVVRHRNDIVYNAVPVDNVGDAATAAGASTSEDTGLSEPPQLTEVMQGTEVVTEDIELKREEDNRSL